MRHNDNEDIGEVVSVHEILQYVPIHSWLCNVLDRYGNIVLPHLTIMIIIMILLLLIINIIVINKPASFQKYGY